MSVTVVQYLFTQHALLFVLGLSLILGPRTRQKLRASSEPCSKIPLQTLWKINQANAGIACYVYKAVMCKAALVRNAEQAKLRVKQRITIS